MPYRLPATGKITIRPGLTDLPVEIALPRDKRAAVRQLILAGIWMMAAFLVITGVSHVLSLSNTGELLALFAVILAVSLGGVLLGLAAMRRYATNDAITLHSDRVEMLQYGIMRKRHWSEALSAYTGLQERTIEREGVSYRIAELAHSDAEKTVPLAVEANPANAASFLREASDLLDIPVISEA